MEFILMFFSRFISNFIIGHLVYVISGRNRKAAYIAYFIFLTFSLLEWLNLLGSDIDVLTLLFFLVALVGPSLMAILVFNRYAGGLSINTRKFTRKIPKKPYDLIVTTQNDVRNILYIVMASFVMLSFSILTLLEIIKFDSVVFKYLLLILAISGFILSYLAYKKLSQIKEEKIVLAIGKNFDLVYETDIKKTDLKFKIKSYFKSELYIVDYCGYILLEDSDQSIEKHYIFWIATGDRVDMKNESFNPYRSCPYIEELKRFKKYEVKQIHLKASRLGHIEFVKETIIK